MEEINHDDCPCCPVQAPGLFITYDTPGFSLTNPNYCFGFSAAFDAKIAPISHMSFLRRGIPYDYSLDRTLTGYNVCLPVTDPVTCAATTLTWEASDVQILHTLTFDADWQFVSESVNFTGGTGTYVGTQEKCSNPSDTLDMALTSGTVSTSINACPQITFTGTDFDGDPASFSMTTGSSRDFCGSSPTTSADFALSPIGIGIMQTNHYSVTGSEETGCPADDTCSYEDHLSFGFDTPADLVLYFDILDDIPCRVFARIYFRPWDPITESWGAEIEQDSIDFHWKPGDGIHKEFLTYPALGAHRSGPIKIYPLGRNIPEIHPSFEF